MSVKIKVTRRVRPKDESKIKRTIYKDENVEIKKNKVTSWSIKKGVKNDKKNK